MNRETIEAYSLGAVGAVKGVWNYYVKPEVSVQRLPYFALGVCAVFGALNLLTQGDCRDDY